MVGVACPRDAKNGEHVLPGGLGREERGKKISETCSEPLARKAIDEEVQRTV